MPRADATEWLRRNRLALPRSDKRAREGLPSAAAKNKRAYISLVNSRAEALGYQTRRSPGCSCRALRMGFLAGYSYLPTRASILSRAPRARAQLNAHDGSDSEKLAGENRESFGGEDRDALHNMIRPARIRSARERLWPSAGACAAPTPRDEPAIRRREFSHLDGRQGRPSPGPEVPGNRPLRRGVGLGAGRRGGRVRRQVTRTGSGRSRAT